MDDGRAHISLIYCSRITTRKNSQSLLQSRNLEDLNELFYFIQLFVSDPRRPRVDPSFFMDPFNVFTEIIFNLNVVMLLLSSYGSNCQYNALLYNTL